MNYLSITALILVFHASISKGQDIVNIYADKSLAEILELKWEYAYEQNDNSAYFFKRILVENDLLIHHFNMDFVVDLQTSKKLHFSDAEDLVKIRSRIADSLLVYDLIDKLVIKNLHTGKIFMNKRKYKKFGFNRQNDTPYFLKDSIVVYKEDKKKLFAFNPYTNKQKWYLDFPEIIYTFQEYNDNLLNVTTRTTFYQLDKQDGEILWSLPIIKEGESSLNSKAHQIDNLLYIWGEFYGINVINLDSREIEFNWLKGRENSDFTMQMIFEGDSIFARTPSNAYCISRSNGKVYWKSGDINIISDISLTDKYIFFEQAGREALSSVLTAFNRTNHKIEYAQFTSEKYPPEATNGGYQNRLDLSKIMLLERTYKNKYLLGSSSHYIYCFEIINNSVDK